MSDARRSGDVGEDADGGPTADRGADGRAEAETESEAQAAEDAEEVGSEWHVWLLAVLVVAGVVLLFAPRGFVPELLANLGALLVLIGVLGWTIRWVISRSG